MFYEQLQTDRWYEMKFTLRELVLVVLAVAIACGWYLDRRWLISELAPLKWAAQERQNLERLIQEGSIEIDTETNQFIESENTVD